tara:strand:+ start:309 stop:410 length:102 start_codon:yes stop_codon:yes gene_type:complete
MNDKEFWIVFLSGIATGWFIVAVLITFATLWGF